MGVIGDGSMNMPYEPDPLAGTPDEMVLELDRSVLATGFVCMATTLGDQLPGIPEHHPALVLRFAHPSGRFLTPIVLILEEKELEQLGSLVDSSANGAIQASKQKRGAA